MHFFPVSAFWYGWGREKCAGDGEGARGQVAERTGRRPHQIKAQVSINLLTAIDKFNT